MDNSSPQLATRRVLNDHPSELPTGWLAHKLGVCLKCTGLNEATHPFASTMVLPYFCGYTIQSHLRRPIHGSERCRWSLSEQRIRRIPRGGPSWAGPPHFKPVSCIAPALAGRGDYRPRALSVYVSA